MRRILSFILWAFISYGSLGQQENYIVVAEPGDGIFSILRKQGLDPVKYYEAFVELNRDSIKNGSFLDVGRQYRIPMVEDSFKKTGVLIALPEGKEQSLFSEKLNSMNRKSNRLNNTVYYLIIKNEKSHDKGFTRKIGVSLAKELMLHGAMVFVLEEENVQNRNTDSTNRWDGVLQVGNIVEEVNERYLKHSGKYQRLLVIRSNGPVKKGKIDLAVYHHQTSQEGQKFAESLQEIFKKHSVIKKPLPDGQLVLEDKKSLYLAKNVLPAISLLEISQSSKTSSPENIPVWSSNKSLTQWLTSGILKDYANLELEDED